MDSLTELSRIRLELERHAYNMTQNYRNMTTRQEQQYLDHYARVMRSLANELKLAEKKLAN